MDHLDDMLAHLTPEERAEFEQHMAAERKLTMKERLARATSPEALRAWLTDSMRRQYVESSDWLNKQRHKNGSIWK